MELICSNCGASINPQDINIATDLAKCSACNTLHRASELTEKVNMADLLVMPLGAKVQMQQGFNKSIELTSPANGFGVEAIGIGIFSIFWIGFIIVWTTFALYGFPPMALFSIPFWIAGFFLAKSTINKIFESQKIVMNDYEVTIEHNRPIFSSKVSISKADIIDVKYTDMATAGPLASLSQLSTNNRNRGKLPEYPTIVAKGKPHYFFQNLPEADQKWAVRLLKHVLVGK
jgi:hypothetical protein